MKKIFSVAFVITTVIVAPTFGMDSTYTGGHWCFYGTLTLAESPYHTLYEINVCSGQTLIIQPGVVLYCASNAWLAVRSGGTLLANGATIMRGSEGIFVGGTVSLHYCNIQYPGGGCGFYMAGGILDTIGLSCTQGAPPIPVPLAECAQEVSVPQTVFWSAVSGAVSYQIEGSASPDICPSCTPPNSFQQRLWGPYSTTSTSFVLDRQHFPESGTLYWHVSAVLSGGGQSAYGSICEMQYGGYPCPPGSVSGVVRDVNGNPIAEALVTRIINGDVLGRRTDADGRFSFEDLPAGLYTLQITHWQYNSQNHTIQLGCNEAYDRVFDLARTPRLPEIDTVHVRQTLDVHQDVLVAGKTTVVIARLRPAYPEIPLVSGLCWVHIDGVPRPLFKRSETGSGGHEITVKPGYQPSDQEKWEDALYFRFDDVPESQNVRFEVQLQKDGQDAGPVKWSAVTEFRTCQPLVVWFVPIATDMAAQVNRDSCELYMNGVKPRLRSMLPYTSVMIDAFALWPGSVRVYGNDDGSLNFADRVICELVPLASARPLDYFIGLYPATSVGGHSGVSGWNAGFNIEDPRDRCMVVCNSQTPLAEGNATLVGHELGHSLFHRDDYGGGYPQWRLDYWGIDAADPNVRPDFVHRGLRAQVNDYLDIMSGPSAHDWPKFDPTYQAFVDVALPSASMAHETRLMLEYGGYCVISGIVGRDSTAPVFEAENLEGEYTPVEPDSGEWRLEWWDAQESELLKQLWFDPVFERREGLLDYASFFIVTSRPENAAIVTLSIGDHEVARITQTASAPSISLLYPNGGESLADSTVIYWTASDLDGDTLRFDVFANRDGGNWEPIAIGVRDTFVTWHTAYFPGTNAGRVKVVVSDGWNNSADSSDGTFTVAAHFPLAYIESPQDRAMILATSYITLSGRASDLEDGNIPYDSLEWYSDLSGFLGRGSLIQAGNLVPGLHQISLTVTDNDGNIGSDMVMVVVLADYDADGMDDSWEVAHGLDTTRHDAYADKDFDELTNGREYQLGTAPDSVDTDGDTHSDGYEVARGSDPKNASSIPTITWINSPPGGWGLVPDGGIGFNDPLSFSWNACSADDSLEPLRYEVYLDADPNFSNPLIAYADALTTVTGTWPLAVGLMYSWKVKVSDIYGHWIWSPVAHVTRGHNPQVPVRIEDFVAQVESNALRLSWSPVTMDTLGNPVTVGLYIVYASPTPDQEFWAIAYSQTNEWLDTEAFTLEWPNWFYQVIASTDMTPPPLVSRRAWPTNQSILVPARQGEIPMWAQPHQTGPENIFQIRRQR